MKRAFLGVALVLGLLTSYGALAGFDGLRRQADAGEVRTFEIVAKKFEFVPSEIEVSKGDRVRIVARSEDTEHGLAVKEFKVKTKIPRGGEPVTVEFVADKAGVFPFVCSEYCGSGHRRMKGRLVVLDEE